MTSLDVNADGTGTAIQHETEFGSPALPVDTTSGIGRTRQPMQKEIGGKGTALPTEPGGTGTTLDLCTTVNSGRLPDTATRKPYWHRFCLSMYGPGS